MLAGRDDHGRIEHLELTTQERRARRDLIGLRVPVPGRAAFHDIRDEDVLALPADRPDQLGQELPRRTDERAALPILVLPGPLADDHDLGLGVALTRHGLRPRLVEAAVRTDPDFGGDRLERRLAPDVRHAVASGPGARYGRAPRVAAGRIQPRS